jgi:hypothetical protein
MFEWFIGNSAKGFPLGPRTIGYSPLTIMNLVRYILYRAVSCLSSEIVVLATEGTGNTEGKQKSKWKEQNDNVKSENENAATVCTYFCSHSPKSQEGHIAFSSPLTEVRQL